MVKDPYRPKKIGVIGTYLPRRCGIATFTHDMVLALKTATKGKTEIAAVAMNDVTEGYPYDADVHLEIFQSRTEDYIQAAEFFNINLFDVVLLQHEFGIFGGSAGEKILDLADRLRVPLVVNLHTVLQDPDPEYRRVFEALAKRADKLVVMTNKAKTILHSSYDIAAEKVAMIPHGTPDFSFTDPIYHKEKFGVLGKKVILTFGLLSPNKGLEVMIEAMPQVLAENPDAVYMIVGSLHPHERQAHGDSYLHKLKKRAQDLGVSDAVKFVDGFFTLENLMEFIEAADVYVTPYLNREQITSGTLAYAMAAGKPTVSTPYWHAEEFLADGRGILTEFNNPQQLAGHVNDLLNNEVVRSTIRKKAYQYCRKMTWPAVARSYIKLFSKLLLERVSSPRPANHLPASTDENIQLPAIDLKYVKAMTDDTGMLEHAKYAIPHSKHGYCTDDNARALIASLLYYQLESDQTILPYIYRYMAFILHAFNHDRKWIRNRLSYSRIWDDKDLSESAHGRALWALGLGCAVGPREIRHGCMKLFHDAMPAIRSCRDPHALAFALQGIHYYLQNFEIDTVCKSLRKRLATTLFEMFESNSSDDWLWLEDTVSWGAAVIPGGLIISGQAYPHEPFLDKGLTVLRWLIEKQTHENGYFSFIGNKGWYQRGEKMPLFDQQPIDAMNMVWACIDAYNITHDPYWKQKASLALNWFLGANPLHIPLYDPITGGCRDGLQAAGANENQGAESTLSWVISSLRYKRLLHQEFLSQVEEHRVHTHC